MKSSVIRTSVLLCLAIASLAQVESGNASLPSDPGMYAQIGSGFTKIIGQIAEFTRTGSRLVSHATIGIKSAKQNIQLPGPHAQTILSPQPMFYFVPPKQEAAAGVNAGDLILIRLEEKPQRRQFEIGAAGLFRASSDISLTHQIQVLRSEARPGVYMITPAIELKKGEYALYLARGEGMAAYVYDFGVQQFQSGRAIAANTAPSNVPKFAARESAPTDDSAAEMSASGPSPSTASDDDSPAQPAPEESATPAANTRGDLGVLGANWQQDGSKGVRIAGVVQGSPAEVAGLRPGYVITYLNGVRVHSTQELTNILAQVDTGSKVRIGFLYKSNLGWMPQETVAILSKTN